MTNSAQGADISSYQPALTAQAAGVTGLDFAFVKATNGTAPEDPEFAANWAALAAAGVHRGAYAELTPEDPTAQAEHFMNVVTGRGLRPGDLLAVVGTDYPVTGEAVKVFCDKVAEIAGPHCPVIVYASLSRLPALAPAAGYPLWVAAWGSSAPASVAPWGRWVFWQWASGGGADGGDRDSFNGTAAELDLWIASYAGTAPAPVTPPAPAPVAAFSLKVPVIRQGSSGQAVKNWQALLVARGYDLGVSGPRSDGIDGTFGLATDSATRDFQLDAKAAGGPDGVVGSSTWSAALTA